jgi:heme-degrading monooxygenase HmoA
MFARLASYGAPGVSREQAVEFFRDKVLADLSEMDGFQEAMVLLSGDGDEVLAVSMWDTEENLHAAEGKTAPHRAARDKMGGKRTGVKIYRACARSGLGSPGRRSGCAGGTRPDC